MPDLTTSQLACRMKELDNEILRCFDKFLCDTGMAVVGMDIRLMDDDSYEYDIQYQFAFANE